MSNEALQICRQQHALTLLIWGINVISISNNGPDGLSQTVSVRFLSALIQQSIWHQARITPALQILKQAKTTKQSATSFTLCVIVIKHKSPVSFTCWMP